MAAAAPSGNQNQTPFVYRVARTFTEQELVQVKARLEELDRIGRGIVYANDDIRTIYREYNKKLPPGVPPFKPNVKENKTPGLREADYIFLNFYQVDIGPFPPKELCAECHEPEPESMYLHPSFVNALKNGEPAPTDVPIIEWLHHRCHRLRVNRHFEARFINTPGYQFSSALKRYLFHCNGVIDGQPCERNTDNTHVLDFQFDHIDPKTKFANVGMLLAVFEQVDLEELWHEINKCQMMCRDCHGRKSPADREKIRPQINARLQETVRVRNEAKDAELSEEEKQKVQKKRKQASESYIRKKERKNEVAELKTEAKLKPERESAETKEVPTLPDFKFNYMPQSFRMEFNFMPVPTPAPVAPPAGPPLPKFDFLNPSGNPVPPPENQEQAEEDDEDEDDEEVPQNKKAKRQ